MSETVSYTLEDIGRMLRVTTWTLKKEIETGRLKASKDGQTYYVTDSQLMAYLEERRIKSKIKGDTRACHSLGNVNLD
jgi:hypothetical protein